MVKIILECEEKKQISRKILENLKEWFEDDVARECYINSK